MNPRARSAATLSTLAVLTLGGGFIGVKALTAPFPEQEVLPTCVSHMARVGDTVLPDQVTVSVYNGSRTNGLASRTLAELTDRGFHRGKEGNAPKKVGKGVQIWADDAKNPAVALVASQFKKATVVSGEALGPGVVVVVGNAAKLVKVTKAPTEITAASDGVICTPPGHDSLLTD